MGTVLLTMSVCWQQPVLAGLQATTAGDHSISSGSWGIQPSVASINFPSLSITPQYLTVTNNRTLSLVGATYLLTTTAGTASLRSCSTTWNETLHTCSGTITTLVTSANSPQSVTAAGRFPASPSSTVRLQASLALPVLGGATVTPSVTVSRAQVRAATTTTS